MKILYLEPFHAGSHRGFGEALVGGVDADWTSLTLPGRFWKWRMRGSAAWFALERREVISKPYDLIFASSYLPLTEFLGLCPELSGTPSVLYFHENQFAYPVREAFVKERDNYFGFTQMISGLSATKLLFNSNYNRQSFLDGGAALFKRLPDAVPRDWLSLLASKSEVLSVPLDLPDVKIDDVRTGDRTRGPLLLWNHRWEFDKNPEAFFSALEALSSRGVAFRVAVCGEKFRRAPKVFEEARVRLGDRVEHWGYAEDRGTYEALLMRSDIAVSTAIHEFFGVAVLEATHFGARPVVPNRLAYKELFPEAFRYRDDDALVDMLERLCRGWQAGTLGLREDRQHLTAPHRVDVMLPRYEAMLRSLASPQEDEVSGDPQ